MPGQLLAQFGLNTEQVDAAIARTDGQIKRLLTELKALDAQFEKSGAENQPNPWPGRKLAAPRPPSPAAQRFAALPAIHSQRHAAADPDRT